MNTGMDPKELLARAWEISRCAPNLDMLDRITLLRGYVGLYSLDPDNSGYQRDLAAAIELVLEGSRQYPDWTPLLEMTEALAEAA